jgi:hypothetical protein
MRTTVVRKNPGTLEDEPKGERAMKMSESTYETLKIAFRTTVDFAGGVNRVASHYRDNGLSDKRMIWDVFHGSMRQIRLNAKNSAQHVSNEAISACVEIDGCEPNGGGCNGALLDAHIETALKRIAKEINLV